MPILRFVLCICIALFLCHSAAFAASSADNALKQIFVHSKAQEPEKAKAYLTARSHALYDRIYKHQLTFLLPQNVTVLKSEVKNGYTYKQFTDPNSSHKQNAIMAFQSENGVQKLDLPETFRTGFGEQWNQTLDIIEQAYIFMKQKYGEEKSVEMIKVLTKKKTTP
jgi:hypothetical protein